MFGMAIAARPAEHHETHGASELILYDRPLTWDDLQRTPEDGLRYELVDGVLLVSPGPNTVHQRVAGNLFVLLRDALVPGLEAFTAPFDWRISEYTVFEPDVLVFRTSDVAEQWLDVPPVLAVEVLSPSTRLRDLNLKRLYYGEAGLEWYWVVDPVEPRLTVFRLEGGRFVKEAEVDRDGEYVAEKPLAVTVVPDVLIEPYPPPD
jgi:Uma2 family endonuclease